MTGLLLLPVAVLVLARAPLPAQETPSAAIADAFMEAWHDRDEASIAGLMAPEAVYTTPSGVYEGTDGAVRYLRNTFAGAPESSMRQVSRAVGDGRVAVEWVWSGTHTGVWPGLPPATGREFTVRGVTFLEIVNGRITRATDYYDRFGFLQQLGVIPAPDSEPAGQDAIEDRPDPAPLEIWSDGLLLRGRFFPAAGAAAEATLLMLPGFPGSPDDVLGLGQRLSSRGINVVVLIPRGMHGSEGTFSFAGALEDIGATWRWLRSDSVAHRFGFDRNTVGIGGYSWGGGMAMAYAATDPSVRRVLSVAGTDHGEFIRMMQRDPDMDAQVRAMLSSATSPDGAVRGDVEAALEELVEGQATYGLKENAASLADRRILLVGGWEDRNVTIDHLLLPLYRALTSEGAEAVRFLTYHDGHGFRVVREELADDIASWLMQNTPPRDGGE